MGCGSSSPAKGNVVTDRGPENFFPSPEADIRTTHVSNNNNTSNTTPASQPERVSKASSGAPSGGGGGGTKGPKKNTGTNTASTSRAPPSSTKSTEERPTTSPKKPKSSYVPPPPINASVPKASETKESKKEDRKEPRKQPMKDPEKRPEKQPVKEPQKHANKPTTNETHKQAPNQTQKATGHAQKGTGQTHKPSQKQPQKVHPQKQQVPKVGSKEPTSLAKLASDDVKGSGTAKKLDASMGSFDINNLPGGEEDSIDADNFLADAVSGDGKAKGSDEVHSDDDAEGFGGLVLNRDEFDPVVVSEETPQPVQQYQQALETPEPSSESGMRFDELYRLKGVLGTGAFSTVREGFHRSNTHFSFAVKCINRKKLSEEDEAALLDEVSILKSMKHKYIIRLYDFFTEPSTYYLVLERMRGGELFDRIVAKAYYTEKEARDTCKILLEAVGYCHSYHVAHRDLKPENLLLQSEDDDSSVKIADFGFAKIVKKPNSLKTQCGTPGYVAPEILEGTLYDERADMWSVGVILYILLGGYPPFIESTQRDLFRKIRKGEYEFHEEYWGTVSQEAKDLIRSLLCVNYKTRLSAKQALKNPWITGDDAKLATRDLGTNLDKLRNFNAKRKFRAAVSTIMAVNKLNSLGNAFFTKPFQKHDEEP